MSTVAITAGAPRATRRDEGGTFPAAGARTDLAAAYAECGRIARASGSSFHQAFRLLPSERRRSLEALYAFCRVVDDAADEGEDGARVLGWWREELQRALAGTANHPVALALGDSVARFAIPHRHLEEILDGVAMDLERQRFATFADLKRYCYHVASAVGLATIPIFGCRAARSRDYAEALGIALQLTNILRDLGEDAERGRIYLPEEDLDRHGYGARELVTHTRNDAFRDLVRFECARARDFYAAAHTALTGTDARALAPAEGMRLVYQRVLRRIDGEPDLVFGPAVRLPRYQKAFWAAVAWLATHLPRRGRTA